MNNNYNSLCSGTSTSHKKSLHKMAALLLFFILMAFSPQVNAQITVTNPGNTTPSLSATYTSLALAIVDVNNRSAISGPVTLTLSAAQTAPAGGYSLTNTAITGGSTTNRFIFDGGGNTITAGVGTTTTTDAFFKVIGADNITLQNFVMSESAGNTTTTTQIEWGVALLYSTSTNGAQNITIQNNTITLNRTNPNSIGIYSNSTHTATAVTVSATATTAAGGNSGLKAYGNTISNVNMGIVVVGPTAAADANTGIDIGGSASTTGNTITNYGTTTTGMTFVNVSGTINGILVRNSIGFNISYNSITSSNGGVTVGTLNGIQVQAASNAPTTTFTNTINNNTIALTTGFSTGAINGITYPSGSASATSVLNVNSNNFTAATSTVASSGATTLISVSSTNFTTSISSNTFTNITSNATGSFTFISNSITIPAGGSQTISSNSIVTAFSKTGAGGTVTGITTGGSSTTGTSTWASNNFSNMTVTGATTLTFINQTDGGAMNHNITSNTFNNITGGSSTITGINSSFGGGNGGSGNLVNNNTITNITSSGAISAITIGSSGTSSTVSGNTIGGLTSTGASAVQGITSSAPTSNNIFQNKIYDLTANNASGTVNGISVNAGTLHNVYNNIIGGLSTPSANAANPLVGINIAGGTTVNVYYNTVRLAGSSTGALFGSSALSASTTPTLDLRNNILVNASSVTGAGLAVAYRRSSSTLTTYATTSNNNLFFGSTMYFDGTTAYTFGGYQTLVATRDSASKFQNPTFDSTTGSASTFLHFTANAINLAGSNGVVISGYTTDFDGNTRDASTPDIGADEWVNGTISAPTITSFTPSTLCEAGGQTVTITGTSLDTVSSVLFNGSVGVTLVGTITGTSTATSMTVITPANTVDGIIRVTNPAGSADSASTFTPAPTPTIGVTAGSTICSGTGVSLTATGGNTYSWSPATGLSATTGATVTASPTTTTTYTVTGTSAAGCTATATVTITVNATPTAVTITKGSATVCSGSVVSLTASGGTIGGSVTGTIGTNLTLTSATSQPTAFDNRWSNDWRQTIYTAAELTAAGLSAGNINSLAYNVTTLGDAATNANLNIKIGTYGSATFPSTTYISTTGFTNVYGPTTYTHTATGWQTINFTTPFVWDGVSNIIVQVTMDGANATNNTITYYTATAGNTTIYTTAGYTAGTTTTGSLSPQRLDIRFAGTNSVATTFAWTPTTNLYTNVGATTAYTGQNVTVVYAKNTGSQTYTATSTSSVSSCSSSSSTTVTPLALPTIAANSASTCTGGAGATLTASGGSTYSWSPPTGLSATSGTSVVATPSATITYTINGTDTNGCVNTTTSTVTVNNAVAITSQPTNAAVTAGADASFTVIATGTGLTYQWQFSTNGGTSYSNVASNGNSATYTELAVTAGMNGYLYNCIVSGTSPCAPVTSTTRSLTVSSVSISAQPQPQTICSNTNATFFVTATGVTSYQWEYSTNGTSWFTVGGATSASYVTSGATSTNSGTFFRCLLNGGAGAGGVTTDSALLTVYDVVAIGTQPTNQSTCEGTSVSFSTIATGSGLTYQWQFSTNGGSSWASVASAGTSATYTISSPTGAMSGNQYRVIVSGTSPCSAVTSNAVTLNVISVSLVASPSSLCLGSSTTLTATFTGSPASASSSWLCAVTGSGATSAVTTNPATITPTATGSYTYTYTTNGTCSFTKTVAVTVNALPLISSATATPATVCSGATINLAAASIANATGTVTVGTGTTVNTPTTHPSPFGNYYWGAKQQFLFTASELSALGLAAGNITSVAFSIVTPTTTALTNYTIAAKATASTALTTTFETGFSTLFTAASYTPSASAGYANNTITFTTPFNWNGTSSIVFEICFNNASYTTNAVTNYTTATNRASFFIADAAGVCAATAATLSSNRPNMRFAGTVATNFASGYTWSWSPGSVSGATATTTVTNTSGVQASQAFTATATVAATGCSSSLTSSAVTINSTIAAPTGTDSTQCGGGVTPTCSVTGTGISGNTFRWYLVATNGTALASQTASTLSGYPISATTTFYVSEVSADGLCESPRTTVNATVTTAFAFSLSASTATNCSGSASLTPVTIATNGGYTSYSWLPSATVSGNETTGWYFSPTVTTTYTLTATGGGCSTTATVTVTPTALPIVTATAAPAAICVGASSTLTALTTTVAAGTATMGAGTDTTTLSTSGTPYRTGNTVGNQFRNQFLLLASELTASGLKAGNITGLKLDVSGTGGGTLSNLTVGMAQSSLTAMTTTYVTGLTQVYSVATWPATGTLTTGLQTHTFATPFTWDGTSNIVIQVCAQLATFGTAGTLRGVATSFVSHIYNNPSTTGCSTTTSTTSSVRPNIILDGQVGSQGVGTLAYTWNDPSATTGNVLTASPTATTAYTVYGLNGTTGCTGTATATVTVYSLPTAPSVTSATQCGTRVPLVSVADTNSYTTPTFKWYADNTTTTALQTSTSTTYTTSVSATTTFYVSVVSPGGCESDRTAVTTTVIAPATLTVSPAATVCTGGSTTLTASGAVSYTWTPALGLNGTTSASVIATPSATTTYSVTGVDANGCTTAAATVVVTVAAYPSALSITHGAASVCTDNVMSLTATGGTITGSGTSTLGTGVTTTSTAGNTPYDSNWEGSRTQYLVRASELTALGITAGNLNSVAFNVTGASAYVLSNFAVKIAKTNDTALSTYGTPVGSFTTVYTNAALPVQAIGTSTITFSTPYAWDGTSNILIDICHDNDTNGTCTSCFSTSATVTYTATTYNSVYGSYADNIQSCGTTATSLLTTFTNRPNMTFGYTTSTATTITWSPTTDLYTNVGATTAYAGGNTSVVYTKPSTERVYTATASNGACTTPATTTVTPLATAEFTLNGTTTICNGQSTVLTATGSGSTYVWSPSTGLNTTTGSTVTANPTSTTTYTVVGTNGTTLCQATKTITVTVIQPGAILTIGTTTQQTVVPGQTATFEVATQSGVVYTYQWQVNTGSGFTSLTDDYVAGVGTYLGSTSATLSVHNINSSFDTYQYQCIVTGPSPCTALTPTVATLTVSDTGFATQPSNATICLGATASFSIVTSGDAPYGTQWQVSTDGGATYTDLADGTDATTGMTFLGIDQNTLNVSGIISTNSGAKFICVLNFFLPSNAATLTVKLPVGITQPADQTVCAGAGNATFSTTATGSDLTYQWQFSTNGGTSWSSYTGDGATSNLISILNPAAAAQGTQYRVVVSGNAACSSVTSAAATLHITNPTIATQPTAATVVRGNTATFAVTASAATSYQWQYSTNGSTGWVSVAAATPLGTTYTGDTSSSLSVITSATTATGSANFYRCVASNGACSATSTGAQLTVVDYCTSSATSDADEEITNVTFGTLNNSSTCGEIATGTGSVAFRYSNYTTAVTAADVIKTANIPFSVTQTSCGGSYGNKFAIFIDWNQDGDFADAGETAFAQAASVTGANTQTGLISVPSSALLGYTRMRVINVETSGTVSACGTYTWGETEDYTINVLPTPACTGGNDLVAGTASAAVSTLCAGNTGTTISLAGSTAGFTGVTFQWQYSTNGTTWTNGTGASATTTSFATGALATGSYTFKCVTTCSAGGFVESNSVAVNVYDPQITDSTPAGRCGTGTVTLQSTANAGATVDWYAAATGGSPLTGGTNTTSFTTPSISATTTYYAQAVNSTCTSARTTVVATVTPQPTATISYAGSPYCFNASLVSVTLNGTNAYTGGTFSSTSGLTIDAATGAIDPSTSTAGTYTITYTTNATTYCTPQTATTTVTVNPSVLNAGFTYANTVYCTNSASASPIITGFAGTFTASPTGLSINATTGAITFATSTPGSYTVTNTVTACGSSDVVTFAITVNQAPVIGTQPASATICSGANASFTVAAAGTGVTYQWEVSTNGTTWASVSDGGVYSGSALGILSITGATVSMNGYKYRALVSDTSGCGTLTSSAATLTVDQPAAPVFTPTSANVCTGGIQTLSVASSSVAQNGVIGTGTVSNTTSTPFKGYWGGSKVQYLYTAGELTALGYTNGTVINSLGMDITAYTSPYTFNGFTVGMKNTATTVLTTTMEAGLTTVKNSSNYVLSGTAPFTVTLPLDSSFTWNGTSNVLVEFCFNNNNGGGVIANSANVKSTTTATALTHYYTSDNSATVCSSTTATTITTRANMRFGVSGGTLVWSPVTDLYTNAGATVSYTGGHASTLYSKPTANRTYTVTATNTAGCTNTSTVAVNVLAPSTLSSITQPAITCSGAQTTYNLTGLLASSTSTISYNVNGGSTQTITGVVADASGNGSFTLALAAFTNGQTLTITSIARTDLSPNCSTTISSGNTVVIAVQPLVTYYADADGDGYGNYNVPQITCQGQPSGYVTNSSDCDDTNSSTHQTTNSTTVAACTNYTWAGPIGNGTTYTTSGTYTYSTTNGSGCTNIETLVLTINSTTTGTTTATACNSYVWAAPLGNGTTYTAGGTHTNVSTNAAGCNHTETLVLTINNSTTGTTTATSCDSYVWAGPLGNGTTYTTGGTYTNVTTNAAGCNHTQTLALTINNSTSSVQTVTSSTCGTYTWSVNGTTYTSSGTYTYTSTNAAGCIDTKTLVLTINPCESVVTVKMNIEGYYDTSTHAMRPVLANQGVGSSTTDVDTVTIELRDATTYALVVSTTATLQTNGNAVATFSTAPVGSFYIVVKHRNAVQTWSASPQTVGGTPLTYDFTDSASKAYGDNMIMLETGVYGFYSGDLNQDEVIDGSDSTDLINDIENANFGLLATDLNGDGVVDGSDSTTLINNTENAIYSVHP